MNTTELKALAEKATPGPWAYGSFGRLLVVPVIDGHPNKHDAICDFGPQHFPSDTQEYNNAEFIAAANPGAILALIAALESAQDERRALLATEQNLRERVKALEEGLRGLLVGCEYRSIGGDSPAWHTKQMPSSSALDSARALLEKTT